MFEEAPRVGGHTNTVRVDLPDATHHVDTGFIVHNDRNYPRFEALLAKLGVESQPSTMSFGVADTRGDFEYCSASANGLFANRAHLVQPWFHRMVAEIAALPARGTRAHRRRLRRRRVARRLAAGAPLLARVRRPADRPAGVGGLVGRSARDVALPGALPGPVLRQPRDARPARPPGLAHRGRGLAGVRRRARAPVAAPDLRLRPRSPRSAATTTTSPCGPRGATLERFDEVVLATHSDQALRMLADAGERRARDPRGDPLPGQRGGAAHRPHAAAAAPAGVGELELPSARRSAVLHDRDVPHELACSRCAPTQQLCVTLNRTDAIEPGTHPGHDRLRPPGLHGGRDARAGAPRRDQRTQPRRTSAARTGAGASTRTAS